MYTGIKHFHLLLIGLSVGLFLIRFILSEMKSPILQKKWLKILPHLVDTLLIVSAVTLCVLIEQYPFVNAWVTEKLLALLLYVFMVTLALKMARTVFMKYIGLLGAISWVAFAGMVAVSKQPILFG
jgi:uncharacterized membrane protein SirB2